MKGKRERKSNSSDFSSIPRLQTILLLIFFARAMNDQLEERRGGKKGKKGEENLFSFVFYLTTIGGLYKRGEREGGGGREGRKKEPTPIFVGINKRECETITKMFAERRNNRNDDSVQRGREERRGIKKGKKKKKGVDHAIEESFSRMR